MMKTLTAFVRAVAVLALVAGTAGAARAQSAANSGQIVGQLTDTTGAAIIGAEVSARNVETNLVRTARSDKDGRYALAALPLGPYEVTVSANGLKRAVQQTQVTLGGSTSVNFALEVAGVSEAVEVGARDSLADSSNVQGKSVLTEMQLQNLPASGRRVRTMFLFTPATQIEPECGGFAISGQKGVYTNISVDGADYTNTHWCGHVEFSPTFSMDAVQEFQVVRSTFSAEFGRSTGGVVNLATKSGTNVTRGTGFFLFRNDKMTLNDPFGRVPIGVGQQFGGSVGGALVKDKTFYFVAPEVQHNTKPVQTLYAALDQQGLRNTAAAQALLSAAPEESTDALSQSQSLVTRIDHRLSGNNTLTGRFDYIRNRVTDSIGAVVQTQGLGADSITNRSVSNEALLTNRNDVTGMFQLSSVLSSRFVNEARAQITHEYRPWNLDSPGAPEVTVKNAGATVAIYGPQATGLAYGNIGYKFSDVRTELTDNLSFVTGAHTAKIGVDADMVNGTTVFNPGANGIYTFNSLADYVARRPFQYQQFAGTGSLDLGIQQIAMYVQDEWRVRPGLTISPGFRYEMALLPDYAPATAAQNRFPLATSIPDDKDLVAPRLGLVWDVNNDGKTIVRGAGGLFYAAPYMPAFEQSILGNGGNPELSSMVTITTSQNPNAVIDAFRQFGIDLTSANLASLPTLTTAQLNQLVAPENRIGQTINYMDSNFRLPRAVQWRVALERTLGRGLVASVDFTDINTDRIARIRNVNLAPPTVDATGRAVFTSPRPYPNFGIVQVTEPSARSNYHGMTLSLSARRTRYTLDAYYTLGYSKSEDDSERGISNPNYDNAYNLAAEYNWSNIDERHQFAGDAVVFLPANVQVSTTVRANSGRPFTALVGSDLNKDANTKDRPIIDGAEIVRNTFRNKGYSEVDLRVQRGFAIGGSRQAILSLELFNLFNADNVEIGAANMVYGPGTVLQNGALVSQAPPASFGQVTDANGNYLLNSTLRTAPFQAQVGLRFTF